MTIHPFRLSTLLILAGAALSTGPAFAESAQSHDRNHQVQDAWDLASAATPDASVDPARRSQNLAANGPMVSAVMPQKGQVGDTVRIQGTGLGSVNKVLFSESRDADFKVVSDTEIQCMVPDGAVPGPIELGTPAGSVRTPVPFDVVPQ